MHWFCSKLQDFGQRPSLQTVVVVPHRLNRGKWLFIELFNQYLWIVTTVKQQKHESNRCSRAVKKKCMCQLNEMTEAWGFLQPSRFLDCSWHCNTRGHNGRRRQRKRNQQQGNRWTHTVVLKSFKVVHRETFSSLKIDSKAAFFPAGSICLTGQVVLNISQFSQRTVELLRTT